MNIIDYAKEYDYIIVPKSIKTGIIEKISSCDGLVNAKVITDQELIEHYTFKENFASYDYIVEKEKVSYAIAKEYVEAMKFIKLDNKHEEGFLIKLCNLKKELLDHKLITLDDSYFNIFNDKSVLVYGFNYISKELELVLGKIEKVEYSNKERSDNKVQVYKFKTIFDELHYLFESIATLLNEKNVAPDMIKIANLDADYNFIAKQLSNLYNIKIGLHDKVSLISYYKVQEFLNEYKETNDLNKAFENFSHHDDGTLTSHLLQAINKTAKKSYESILFALSNTYVSSDRYTNEIEVVNLDNAMFNEDTYLFILGFNQGKLPGIYKNEDLLDDKLKEILQISTSSDKNKYAKDDLDYAIHAPCHVSLSYPSRSELTKYNPSTYIKANEIKECDYQFDYEKSHSESFDQLMLSILYDEKTPVDDEYLQTLNSNYEIDYLTYSNDFTGIDSLKIENYIKDNDIKFSYTSLNDYYECGFKYLLNDLLKAKIDDYTCADIGNVFHHILEKCYDDDFDFELAYQEELSKLTSPQSIFFMKTLKQTLIDIININNEFEDVALLKKHLSEYKVHIDLKIDDGVKKYNAKVKGSIDKLLYDKVNDMEIATIIDYKTNNPRVDLDKVQYGLGMQLPMYVYLLKHSKHFKDAYISGFYYQTLLQSNIKACDDPYEELKSNIRLSGRTNSDPQILSNWDPLPAGTSSVFIKSLVRKKDGTLSMKYPQYLLTTSDIDEICKTIEQKVKEAITNIFHASFEINPKIYKTKEVSCSYCKFRYVCYKKYKDLIDLTPSSEDDNSEED